ncbi:gamma-glutamyl transpeptidase 4 isoform X3 [Tasmannia lanceolata]
MYEKNHASKVSGVLSMGVPGEIAGLHAAWVRHGRRPWSTLFQPSIRLARDGFEVAPYLASAIKISQKEIMADPGLRTVFAPNGKLLETGDTCYNLELSRTLEAVAEQGLQAFYNGSIAENLVRDVQKSGGILTMEDLHQYTVEVKDAMVVDALGYSILGMPPPSSGTAGLALVLNILESYGTSDAAKGSVGLHRLVESLKHMFAIRMNLGDPDFVNVTEYVSDMLSLSYAQQLQQKILDNTTFPADYYMSKWSQLRDHGTSHFCIVDADRNALSMTTTVNYYFGAKVLSPSTGIVLNNEMNDFSTPTETSKDKLPPAPSNFIRPNKRPLSSMTPIIILKDNQLAGVIGGSGGLFIIPAVIQVFLNHFILGMEPLAAVQHPRVYHELIPNVVLYENWTVIDGDHIELSQDSKLFLKERGHLLSAQASGAICQLVVHNIQSPTNMEVKHSPSDPDNRVFHGMLTAVSDPRKDGRPAGI